MEIKSSNTILYCKNWESTMFFFKEYLEFPVNFANSWFVEFKISETAFLSIADEKRSTIKSSESKGLTIAFQTLDIEKSWNNLNSKGVELSEIRTHPWGQRVFYFHDPENHRIEIWEN